MDAMTWEMLLLGLVAGLLAGAGVHAWWRKREEDPKLRMPETWPLRARGLVTTEEQEVWAWLRRTFDDHTVMVKVPVPRFTIPTDKADKSSKAGKGKTESERWLEVLNGVYTTFSICTTDGKVMGCVDVPGRHGLSEGNRELKESLLSDCGIGYTVVRAGQLPAAKAMRAAFLGELAGDDEEAQTTRGGDSSFYADLDAFTREKMQAAKEAALKELNRNARDTAQPAPSSPRAAAAAPGRRPAKAVDAVFKPESSGAYEAARLSGRLGQGQFNVPFEDSFTRPSDLRPARLE